MKELIRTKVDMFEIGSSLSFEDLERNKDNIEKNLISIEDIFKDWPKIILKEVKKELFINGVNLKGFDNFCDWVYKIYCNDFIGLGIIKNGFLKRDIVI